MEMDIQIERAAEPLDQGYCPGLGRPTGKPRLLDQMCGNATVDDAQPPPLSAGRHGSCGSAGGGYTVDTRVRNKQVS